MNQLTTVITSANLPTLIAAAGDRTATRFLEFFASTIRNPHTRRAYARAVGDFLAWCEEHGVPSIAAVQPLHVAAWIEGRTRERSAPTVKQQLAGLCCKLLPRCTKAAINGSDGFSGRFELEALVEKLDCLGQGRGAEAEGALDDAGLALDVAGKVEGCGLPLAESARHLEALDGRVGRLQRLEASDRPDQLLELAVVGLVVDK
jgi:hypothetical protein